MRRDNYLLHILLLAATLVTTTLAGAELVTGKQVSSWRVLGGTAPAEAVLSFQELLRGLPFSLSFLAFLFTHEMGHYLMAVRRKVQASLPYFIPVFIPFGGLINIGSFGAVIRLREQPKTRNAFFDIGVAGPLAGFVISVALLVYGFLTLPPAEEYIYKVHPEYETLYGHVPTAEELGQPKIPGPDGQLYPYTAYVVEVGNNFLYDFLGWLLAPEGALPPPHEMMHYPFLFAGFLTLFFTALNLLPMGQLDGGHVVYGLFGARAAGMIGRITVAGLVFLGGTGLMAWRPYDAEYDGSMGMYVGWNVITTLIYALVLLRIYRTVFNGEGEESWAFLATAMTLAIQGGLVFMIPGIEPNIIWLLYAFLASWRIGMDHPVTLDERELTPLRKALGWAAIAIFILCFTTEPLRVHFLI